ncbi:hypothetical protein AC481_06285 [miscellaneous Crenarchaeota group archaeon SMTZ-80]|nr:MAG: hypothetical protein AC481_06285 [miscellaneous Crenarchaeota group archaeon SMTZ-80]
MEQVTKIIQISVLRAVIIYHQQLWDLKSNQHQENTIMEQQLKCHNNLPLQYPPLQACVHSIKAYMQHIFAGDAAKRFVTIVHSIT